MVTRVTDIHSLSPSPVQSDHANPNHTELSERGTAVDTAEGGLGNNGLLRFVVGVKAGRRKSAAQNPLICCQFLLNQFRGPQLTSHPPTHPVNE